MSEAQTTGKGLLASCRRFLCTLLEIAQNRAELFSLELREERMRVVQALVLASAAVFLSGMAVILTTFTIVFAFWETRESRLIVLGSLSGFYILASIVSFVVLRKNINRGMPFSGTIQELKKDREWLREQK